MTRSRTKQLVDTLQQMVSDILNKAQVEKDEDPEAEALLRILIVAESLD